MAKLQTQVVAEADSESILSAMEIAALIIVIGSAALLAGLVYGASYGFSRYRSLPYPAYWFAIAGALLGAGISASVINGWPGSVFASDERVPVTQVLPYMAALYKHEPQLYERVETLILRDRQDGRSEEDVRSNAMAQTLSFVADKASQLPDDLIYELYSFTRDELAYLAQTKEFDTCSDLALGRIRGDIEGKLSAELVERYRAIVVRIIATPGKPDLPKMGAEPFSAMIAQAFALASQSTGIAPNELETLLAGTGSPEKVCKLMKNFFDTILAQPVDVAATGLRVLAAGERTTR